MPEDNILQTGPLTYREIRELNQKNSSADSGLSDRLSEYLNSPRLSPRESERRRLQNATPWSQIDVGFGESRYDKRITNEDELQNLAEFRAQQQSAANQVLAGFGKALVLTGTTFVDTFAGTAAGIINFGKEAIEGNIKSGADALNAFVANPVSEALQQVNDWSEKIMPNYYTEQENNMHWYQKMFTGNFIGDHFVKNLGFFAGAYLSGRATAGLLTKAMSVDKTRKIFEGAVKAATGKNMEGKEAINAILKGEVQLTDKALEESLVAAAKTLKNEETLVKAVSSIAGAMGESRIEAITGSDEDFNRKKSLLDKSLDDYINGGAEAKVAEEHPEWFSIAATRDAEGNIVGYHRVISNLKAQQEINNKIEDKKQKYNGALEEITRQKIDYANSTFLMNMAVLASDYAFQFGDAFVGGFTKARIAKNLVKLVDGKYKKMAGAEIAKQIAGAAMSPIAEGTQEMFQEAIQKTAQRYYGKKLNDYYGQVIDPEAQDFANTYLSTFIGALGDVYTDRDEWENFALGAATALLGMPGMVSVRDEQGRLVKDEKGREKKKLQWRGEFYEGIRNAREISKQAGLDEKALNDIIQDPNKRELYFNLIRQIVNTDKQQKALIDGDQKLYKDAEYDKLVSRALTYIETGRYQDLLDEIDKIYTIEEKDIDDIKNITKDPTTGESIYDGKTNKEIIESFAQQKKQVLEQVEHIKNVSESINRLYANAFSREGYNTMVSLATTIDDREDRIKQISGEILDYFRNNTVAAQKLGATGLKTLEDINNLAIYISSDSEKSQLEKLEDARKLLKSGRARGERGKFISTGTKQKLAELDKREKELQEIIRNKERDEKGRFKKGYKESTKEDYATLSDVQKSLAEVKDIMQSGNKPLEMPRQIEDLERLLIERESLITALNGYSDNPITFETTFYQELENSINARKVKIANEKYKKIQYASASERMNEIKAAAEDMQELAIFKQRAEQNGDKEVIDAINEYEKMVEAARQNYAVFKKYESDEDLAGPFSIIQSLFNDALNKAETEEQYKNDTNQILETIKKSRMFGDDTDTIVDTFKKEVESINKSKKALEQGKKNKEEKGSKEEKSKKKNKVNVKLASLVNKLLKSKNLDADIKKLGREDIIMLLGNEDIATYAGFPDAELEELESYQLEDLQDSLIEGFGNMKQAGISSYDDISDEESQEEDGQEEATKEEDAEEEKLEEPEAGETIIASSEGEAERASKKQSSKKQPIIHMVEPSKEDKDGNVDENQQIEGDEEDAWAVNRKGSKYNINELKDREKRKATIDKSHWARGVLDSCKAQEFIDSGELAELVKKYGSKLKFRFVSVRTSNNNQERNNEENNTIFIAVDIPDGYTVKNGSSSNAITVLKGESQKVQLLGQVSANDDANFNKLKKQVIEYRNQALDANELNKSNINAFVVASSDYTTNVEMIFSGRIVKTNDEFDTVQQRDLVDLFAQGDNGELGNLNGKIQLGIVTSSGMFTIGDDLDGDIVPLNSYRGKNNASRGGVISDDVVDRKGTPWLLVKEADGKVYSKAIIVKSFDENYTDDNSHYAKQIKRAVSMLVDAKTDNDVRKAMHLLLQYLYIPNGEAFKVNPSKGILIKRGEQIDLDAKDAKKQVYDFLKEQGYKFTFGNNTDSLNAIVSSNIFTTDLAQVRNANASLLVSRLEISDDGTYQIIPSERIAELKAVGAIHTGNVTFESTRNYGPRIQFGTNTTVYRQRGSGPEATFWIDDNGRFTEVEDDALRFKIQFATAINNGTLKPIKSNGKNYLFVPRGGKRGVRVYKMTDENGNDRYMTEEYYLLTNEDLANFSKVLNKSKGSRKAKEALKENQAAALGEETKKKQEKKEPEGMVEDKKKDSLKGIKRGKLKVPSGSINEIKAKYAKELESFSMGLKVMIPFRDMRKRLFPDIKIGNEAIQKISEMLGTDDEIKRLQQVNKNDDKQVQEYLKSIEYKINCIGK